MKRGFVFLLFLAGVASAAQLHPGQFFASGPSSKEKVMALTFDDGPGPNTEKFLDLLDRYQVKATFFMQGTQVKSRPNIAGMVARRGHEIASHTWQHLNYKAHLKKLKAKYPGNAEGEKQALAAARKDLVADMRKTRALIEKISGVKLTFCRMPHGIDGAWVREAAGEAGFVLVNWTFGMDWNDETADKLIPSYIKAIQPGAIILLHDGWPKSEKSLIITEAVLKAAKEKGYAVVTVGELLGR